MTSQATFRETLDRVLTAEGPRLSTLDPGHTVRPDAGDVRPVLDDGLGDFGEELGRGGMGVVRVATQRVLHRPVAVKSLRLDDPPPAAVRHLLHEAYAAGLLDHPNILPVHDIVVDDDGRPHIVMKRVEGRPWSHWARHPDRIREAFGASDALAWNLDVLLQVCNAVAYAHDRGILHRDLKLDNVMIGAFGEVLVLDWGVAVALDDRYGDRLPRAADQRRVAGTPRYMAPEMALGHGHRLGPATDVYLLGGLLHHILTGRPPHRGRSVEEVLAGIPDARPTLPERAPRALARIVERALAFDPADRHADVLAFQREVRAFVEHRGSVRLARRAGRSLQALVEQVEAADADRATLHRLFNETRFGFEQALSDWPDNEVAAQGLRRARTALARWELDREEPGTALALLEPLDPPPPRLIAEARQAVQVRRAAQAELESLRADADPTIGQRTRLFVLGLVGLVWLSTPVLYGLLQPRITWTWLIGGSLVLLALVVGLGIWARDSLSRTALNRASWATVALLPLIHLVVDLAGLLGSMTPEQALLLRPALWALIAGMFAVTRLPRLAPAAVLYAAVAVVAPVWPALLPWGVTVANVALLGLLAWVWWSPGLLRDPDEG